MPGPLLLGMSTLSVRHDAITDSGSEGAVHVGSR